MEALTKDHIDSLVRLPLPELISRADEVRRNSMGSRLEICSIINAKSGLCGEDCKFCAQSSRHSADVSVYPLKKKNDIIKAADNAKRTNCFIFIYKPYVRI